MHSEFVNKYLKSAKFNVLILLTIITILFFIISYSMVRAKVTELVAWAHLRTTSIERYIDSSISGVYQIMHGLSIGLMNEPIEPNNDNIKKLINTFNADLNSYISVPFMGFKVINQEHIVVYDTMIPEHLFFPTKDFINLELLEDIKYTPVRFKVGAIHSEGRNNHDIMQFCVAIKGLHNRKYFGAICSVVTLEEINNKLSTIFSAATHGNFKLRNSDYKSNKKIYTIDEAFSFSELFKACFSNEKIIIHFPIQNHPFLIEVELKPYKFGMEVMLILLLCAGCIQVMAIFIYLLFLIYKKYYQKPLFSIQSKLNEFPEDMINQQARLKLVNANINNNIDVFVSVVNELLEDYRSLYINSRKDNTELEEIELYSNILYLILSERYKNSSKLINNTNLSILYFNQLKKLINEEQRECNLSEFLKDLVKGYSKYYKFPTIDILISEEDCKKFTCKQSSLSEAIGHTISHC